MVRLYIEYSRQTCSELDTGPRVAIDRGVGFSLLIIYSTQHSTIVVESLIGECHHVRGTGTNTGKSSSSYRVSPVDAARSAIGAHSLVPIRIISDGWKRDSTLTSISFSDETVSRVRNQLHNITVGIEALLLKVTCMVECMSRLPVASSFLSFYSALNIRCGFDPAYNGSCGFSHDP